MNEAVGEVLRSLVERYGDGLASDTVRTETLLRDRAGEHRREVAGLIAVVREGVGATIVAERRTTDPASLLARLTMQLEEDGAIASDVAVWAVRTWAMALGLNAAASTVPETGESIAMDGERARPTLVVARDGSTGFRTISAAIAAAPTGARIIVRPGTYVDSFFLDREIEVIGAGPPESIIVEALETHACEATAPEGSIRGITFRGAADRDAATSVLLRIGQGALHVQDCHFGPTAGVGIAVEQGVVDVRDCHFGPTAGVGVAAMSSDAAVAIRNSEFLACGRSILASAGGVVTVESCRLSGSDTAGIEASDGGRVEVLGTHVTDCARFGVLVDRLGQGLVSDCDVIRTGEAGVAVRGQGLAEIRQSRFYRCRGAGIHISAHATAEIEDCDLAGWLPDEAEAAEEASRAREEAIAGAHRDRRISITFPQDFDRADVSEWGLITERWTSLLNRLGEFVGLPYSAGEPPIGGGLVVGEGGRANVRRCSFRDTIGGIVVLAGGQGTFEDCELRGILKVAFRIEEDGDPDVRSCSSQGTIGTAVAVGERGRGTFVACEFGDNAGHGVVVAEMADPVFRRCVVRDSGGRGVFIEAGGRGTFEECDITGSRYAGVELMARANPQMRGCRIDGNERQGIIVHAKGKGTFDACTGRGNGRPNHWQGSSVRQGLDDGSFHEGVTPDLTVEADGMDDAYGST